MADTGDLTPLQFRVMEVLSHTSQEWTTAYEVFCAIEKTDPRTRPGQVVIALHRLKLPDKRYVEHKRDMDPEDGMPKGYFRLTSDGTRAYDNSKKAASRSPLSRRHQPAPSMA